MRAWWLVLVASFGLAGCIPVTLVRVEQVPLQRALATPQATVADGKGLSRYTARLLSRTAATERNASVEELFSAAARADDAAPADRAIALAELAMQSARSIERDLPEVARSRYLLAAAQAHDALRALLDAAFAAGFDGRITLARDLYNAATGKVLESLLAGGAPFAGFDARPAGRRYRVVLDDPQTLALLARYDEFPLAWTLDIEGLRTRYEREGLGVPLVGWRRARPDEPGWRYGPDGLTAPLTGWLQFEEGAGDTRVVRVMLRDSRQPSAGCVAQQPVPLAADFSAPLAFAWSHSRAAQLGREGLRGRPVAESGRGFQLLEPYDPQRIPLVLVHGLASSPQIWRNLINEVLGSPGLRERYQVWLYAYPTSESFLVAAQRFRADFRALLDELHVASDAGIVVVGHSMGGLLAKTLVVDSGTALWDAAFTVRPEALQVPAAAEQALRDALVLKPWPEIGRVVFLGTPHGGSDLADTWWARVVESLIDSSATQPAEFAAVARGDAAQVRPAVLPYIAQGRFTSIDALSPGQPLLQAFRRLPIDPRVPFDTFYGTAVVDALGRSGDGAVRVEDARLEGAASEHAYPVKHGGFDQPEILAELRRILERHAAQSASHTTGPCPPPAGARETTAGPTPPRDAAAPVERVSRALP